MNGCAGIVGRSPGASGTTWENWDDGIPGSTAEPPSSSLSPGWTGRRHDRLSLAPLFCLGRRNLAHDLVWVIRIRIPDCSHRDVQIVTIARGRRLREYRRNNERKHHSENQPSHGSDDGLTTTHAMSSIGE